MTRIRIAELSPILRQIALFHGLTVLALIGISWWQPALLLLTAVFVVQGIWLFRTARTMQQGYEAQ